LYYRLAVVPIELPPLRERADDIEALSRHFLAQAAAEGLPRRHLTEAGAEILARQQWRGNVRELRNFIYRLALLARDEVIDATSIEPLLAQTEGASVARNADPGSAARADLAVAVDYWLDENNPAHGEYYNAALAAFERPLFLNVLGKTGGNQLRAAQMLGINRNTLRKRLSDLGIFPDDYIIKD
jgi:two-component system nitrogen regulation response regulator GlnG